MVGTPVRFGWVQAADGAGEMHTMQSAVRIKAQDSRGIALRDGLARRKGNGSGASLRLSGADWEAVGQSLGLTRRQLQIVMCVFEGLKERSMAQRLSITRNTVHTHVKRLYAHLGVTNRCELVVRVFFAFLDLSLEEMGVDANGPSAWRPDARGALSLRAPDT